MRNSIDWMVIFMGILILGAGIHILSFGDNKYGYKYDNLPNQMIFAMSIIYIGFGVILIGYSSMNIIKGK